jgi:formate hydrogenlyase subunit 3/multisubunit Na+/H+ antiporter MnhD subunit
MNELDLLLSLSALTVVAAFLLGNWRPYAWLAGISFTVQLALLATMVLPLGATPEFAVFGQPVGWQLDGYGRFFALITVGAALASTAYMGGEWGERYAANGHSLRWLHGSLALNVLAMLLLLASRDLIAFFIGWELTSWAGFLLMAQGGDRALKAALGYVPYAMAGAMAVLGGIVLTLAWAGTLDIDALAGVLPHLTNGRLALLLALFAVGFSIKMGLMPFHLWQTPAYAEAPGAGTGFLGAISARMGMFALGLLLVKMMTLARVADLSFFDGVFSARDLLAWIAAFTIVLPTFTALRQNDARYLLAWHGIGQGGYMLIGILMGDATGSAGGLLHVFNHATYQAALVLSVFAVIHRTGTADLNSLGGLVTRMPLTFLVMLLGIIGLAGLPPMNGFVSKWLVYRSLMMEGRPLLFLMTVLGTLGTILSVYKLIHNTFLGQLRAEHEQIREAPWSMTIPMLALVLIAFVTGVAPGLALSWVNEAQAALGLPVMAHTLGGIESPRGSLDMLWVVGVLFGGFGIGALLFYGVGGRSKRIHQLDNYAGGHFLSADVRYHYSDHFYAGLMHRIEPLYRGSFVWLESALAAAADLAASFMQAWYRQALPALTLLAAAALAIGWTIWR